MFLDLIKLVHLGFPELIEIRYRVTMLSVMESGIISASTPNNFAATLILPDTLKIAVA